MKSLAKKVHRFLVSEDGPTAVEYAVMLALIVIVCLTAIQAIGTRANSTFDSVSQQLGTGGGGGGGGTGSGGGGGTGSGGGGGTGS